MSMTQKATKGQIWNTAKGSEKEKLVLVVSGEPLSVIPVEYIETTVDEDNHTVMPRPAYNELRYCDKPGEDALVINYQKLRMADNDELVTYRSALCNEAIDEVEDSLHSMFQLPKVRVATQEQPTAGFPPVFGQHHRRPMNNGYEILGKIKNMGFSEYGFRRNNY